MFKHFLLLGHLPAVKTHHFIGFVFHFFFFNLSVYAQIHRAVGRLAGTQMKKISAGRIFLFLPL